MKEPLIELTFTIKVTVPQTKILDTKEAFMALLYLVDNDYELEEDSKEV